MLKSHLVNRLMIAGCALFATSCMHSASSMSRSLAAEEISKAPDIIVLPARMLPFIFHEKTSRSLNNSASWGLRKEDVEKYNVGETVSRLAVERLRELSPSVGNVRLGPGWTMSPDEVEAIYGGTHTRTVFSDTVYGRTAVYLGEVGFSHDPDWVTGHYEIAQAGTGETWLLDPFIVYISLGPSGFELVSFFHLYDLRTGRTLARMYPGPSDLVLTPGDLGEVADESTSTFSGTRTTRMVTLADIEKDLEQTAQSLVEHGLTKLGLIKEIQ